MTTHNQPPTPSEFNRTLFRGTEIERADKLFGYLLEHPGWLDEPLSSAYASGAMGDSAEWRKLAVDLAVLCETECDDVWREMMVPLVTGGARMHLYLHRGDE